MQFNHAGDSTSMPVHHGFACHCGYEPAPAKRLSVQATRTKTAPVLARLALHLPPCIQMSQQQLGHADL